MLKIYKSIWIGTLLLLAGCRETLIHDLSEIEANTAVIQLHAAGIKSFKEHQPDGAWSILVNGSDAVSAMQALSVRRLLRKNPPERKATSLLASREQQQLQYERALSSEIEYTLASVPGVLDARVHLNLPVRDPLFGDLSGAEAKGSASVLLVVEHQAEVSTPDITRLVAGAAGIDTGRVSILTSISRRQELDSEIGNHGAAQEINISSGWFTEFNMHVALSVLSSMLALLYLARLLRKTRLSRRIRSLEQAIAQPGPVETG